MCTLFGNKHGQFKGFFFVNLKFPMSVPGILAILTRNILIALVIVDLLNSRGSYFHSRMHLQFYFFSNKYSNNIQKRNGDRNKRCLKEVQVRPLITNFTEHIESILNSLLGNILL